MNQNSTPMLGAAHHSIVLLSCATMAFLLSPTQVYAQTFKVSAAPDRTFATPLAGGSIAANAYVFLDAEGARQVEFFLDGVSVGIDENPPWDLAGTGSGGLATPFETRALNQGEHVATAVVSFTTGDPLSVQATFEVNNDPRSAAGHVSTYASTGWTSLHRDHRNSDYTPFVGPEVLRPAWTALEGYALLTAPSEGPDGTLYVASAQGPGYSNLHALSPEGDILWQSAPFESYDDLDSEAGTSSPIVDGDGHVYIADANQLWAFYGNGDVKWVVPVEGSFITAVFTAKGHITGITSDGAVHLMDRATGALLAPVLHLPGVDGPDAPPSPAGLWEDMMDANVIEQNWGGLLGLDSEVVNTPCYDPFLNRLFTVGTGATPEEGVFYGIDLHEGALSIAFQTPVGPGSGTSPAMAPDYSQVYTGDGDGVFYAIDTATGDILWARSMGDSLGSPSVGPDGTIYTLADGGLGALTPDGDLLWQRHYDDVAADYLPILPSADGPIVPVSLADTTITVTPTHLYLGVVLGYEIPLEDTGDYFLLVEDGRLLVLDQNDGSVIRQNTQMMDSSENVVSPSANGNVYLGYLSAFTSVTYNSLNADLPPFLQVDAPIGGVSAFEPVFYDELLSDQIAWTLDQAQVARIALSEGDYARAWLSTGVAFSQVGPARSTVGDARAHYQIRLSAAKTLTEELATAESRLADVYNRLAHLRLDGDDVDPLFVETISGIMADVIVDLEIAGSVL